MTNTTMFAKIPADKFGQVACFVGYEDIRFYLHGVMIRVENGRISHLVATDGHAMAIAKGGTLYSDTEDGEYIVLVSKKLHSACKSGRNERFIQIHNGMIGVYETVGQAGDGGEEAWPVHMAKHVEALHLIDGTFPDWRRIVPKDTNPAKPERRALGMLTKNLAKLVDAGKWSRDTNPEIEWLSMAVGKPQMVTIDNGQIAVVFMPARTKSDMQTDAFLGTYHSIVGTE